MPVGGRVWGVGKLLLLLGALVATFFLFAGMAMRIALRAREVQVPTLVGQTVDEATRALTDVGLTLRIDENRRSDPKVPQGHVMQQDPPAGSGARRQRTVRVWISTGPRAISVPPLVGQTERTARIRLQQDGISISSMTEVHSSDYPADVVVAQDPAPASRASQVALLVNRGLPTASYVMPDLIGVDGAKAAEALRARGLRVTIVGSQPYPGVPPGTVVRQQPAGGFQVGQGDAISLEVSR